MWSTWWNALLCNFTSCEDTQWGTHEACLLNMLSFSIRVTKRNQTLKYPLKGGEEFIWSPSSLSFPTNQDLSNSEQMPLNFWIASFSLCPPKHQISWCDQVRKCRDDSEWNGHQTRERKEESKKAHKICVWYRHTLLRFTDTVFLANYRGNPASSKSTGTIFPTAFAHFMYSCHILVIPTIFQTFSLLLYLFWWCVISDFFMLLLQKWHTEGSDDG